MFFPHTKTDCGEFTFIAHWSVKCHETGRSLSKTITSGDYINLHCVRENHLSCRLLTTFCKPSIRLLTTTRRPLSSWNMVLSSSQERSHISAPISSVFWPMMFVVMEGLTSTISVLSLTIFASSGGAKENKTTRHRGEWASKQMNEQHRLVMENNAFEKYDDWNSRTMMREHINFLFCRSQPREHNDVVITLFIVIPKNRCPSQRRLSREMYLFEMAKQ